MYHINVTPRATEKAYKLVSEKNTYIFDVPVNSNKNQIKAAIESQYDVKVSKITTAVQQGKAVRFSRGPGRYPGTTTRKDSKKAYVKLAEGSIDVFESPTDTEQEAK